MVKGSSKIAILPLDCHLSNSLCVTTGTPQGSILSPFLCLIYILIKLSILNSLEDRNASMAISRKDLN